MNKSVSLLKNVFKNVFLLKNVFTYSYQKRFKNVFSSQKRFALFSPFHPTFFNDEGDAPSDDAPPRPDPIPPAAADIHCLPMVLGDVERRGRRSHAPVRHHRRSGSRT